MEIGANKGKKAGKVGYTLTCGLQSKYQGEIKIKSASTTVFTELTPKEVINKIKKVLK